MHQLEQKEIKNETQTDWLTGEIRNAMKKRDIQHRLKN